MVYSLNHKLKWIEWQFLMKLSSWHSFCKMHYNQIMRVVLLYTCDTNHLPSMYMAPLGLAYLISSAKEKFPDYEYSIEVDIKEVIKRKPDLIGICSYTENYNLSRHYARECLKHLPEARLIVGGPHMTSLPLTLSTEFDVGVVGEGEETFQELLELIHFDKWNATHFQKISGIVFHGDQKVIQTPLRPTNKNLDVVLKPAREFLKCQVNGMEFNWPQHLHSTRGCPYECIFCAAKQISGNVRYHSCQRIVSEIKDIYYNYGQDYIHFSDDLFTLKRSRIKELSEAIVAEGLNQLVSFSVCARTSNLDPKMVEWMNAMNVRKIACGFESGSQPLLQYLKGHYIKVEDNQRAIDLCYQYGIQIAGNFILGSPPETRDDLYRTYWFVRKNREKLRGVYFCHTTPLPKTPWWHEAIRQKQFTPETVDYDVLKVYYEPGESYFMNLHYSQKYYQTIYDEFKFLERALEQDIPSVDYNNELWNRIKPEMEGEVLWLSSKSLPEGLWAYAFHTSPVVNKKYDMIVLDNYLSSSPEWDKRLLLAKEALEPEGKLFIFEDNPLYLPFLISILSNIAAVLTGKWNLKELKARLRCSQYDILKVEPIETNDLVTAETIAKNFAKMIPIQNIFQLSKIKGYLVQLGPIQSKDLSSGAEQIDYTSFDSRANLSKEQTRYNSNILS